jgi:methanogenic corrinoid protein MtbC1
MEIKNTSDSFILLQHTRVRILSIISKNNYLPLAFKHLKRYNHCCLVIDFYCQHHGETNMSEQSPAVLLLQFMLNSDRKGASAFIQDIQNNGTALSAILNDILDPALKELGDHWSRTQISLAQGFVAAKIAEDTLNLCLPENIPESSEHHSKGSVVLGNIEDDFHSLGRRMVASFLRASNWTVIDLGNDVLAEQFVNAALESQSCIIGASAMMYTTALNIKKLRNEIDKRNLEKTVKLAVGGAVFGWRPELAQEVGGDGTAVNAFGADTLFTNLLNTIKEV